MQDRAILEGVWLQACWVGGKRLKRATRVAGKKVIGEMIGSGRVKLQCKPRDARTKESPACPPTPVWSQLVCERESQWLSSAHLSSEDAQFVTKQANHDRMAMSLSMALENGGPGRPTIVAG